MGKRSFGQFGRRDRDQYPTPPKAVTPLIPYLRGIKTFAEFCAGDGALVRALESYGLTCAYSGDISTGQDALTLTAADCNGADAGITNPPHTREVLHPMVEHPRRVTPSKGPGRPIGGGPRDGPQHVRHWLRTCRDSLAMSAHGTSRNIFSIAFSRHKPSVQLISKINETETKFLRAI